jgi:Gas vesicle synthesis protein GvpL/GvpF
MIHLAHRSICQKVRLLGVVEARSTDVALSVADNVLAIESEGLAALFQPENHFADATPLAHHRAVVSLSRVLSLLPSRYGVPISRDILGASLQTNATLLRDRLDRVGGAVEIGFTLHPGSHAHASPGAAATGRDFLKQRGVDHAAARARHAVLADVDQALIAAMGIGPQRVSYDSASRRNGIRAGSILEQRAGAPDTASRLGMFLKQAFGCFCRVEISGPWPAYSFGTKEVFV